MVSNHEREKKYLKGGRVLTKNYSLCVKANRGWGNKVQQDMNVDGNS